MHEGFYTARALHLRRSMTSTFNSSELKRYKGSDMSLDSIISEPKPVIEKPLADPQRIYEEASLPPEHANNLQYCSEWVILDPGLVSPTSDSIKIEVAPEKADSEGTSQEGNINTTGDDSESEVDDIILVEKEDCEPSDGDDVSSKPAPALSPSAETGKKSRTVGRSVRTPVKTRISGAAALVNSFVSCMRSPAGSLSRFSTPSPRYRPYDRNTRPGDWGGVRYGDIDYALLPFHLYSLLDLKSKWSFSRTSPMSNCHNRNIGDIHFAPGEVKGYDYWVCCEAEEAEYGRDWVPWALESPHPLHRELVLQHYGANDAPFWVRDLSVVV
ncbi:hypothetical protein FRC12_020405 [Ceratobasidium sp. 428]|nr:hypothetical protein FRC12_020405 [Ceratobasidium sp. 428]